MPCVRLLLDALAVRTDRDAGKLDQDGVAAAIAGLEARADKLLSWHSTVDANRCLLKHLTTERSNLFTFLQLSGVEATNWRSEHAIRPIVVTRKVFGGNRSSAGARVQKILCSFLRSCWQQGRDPIPVAHGAAVLTGRDGFGDRSRNASGVAFREGP